MHQPERARSHSELDRCSPLPTPGQDTRSGSSSVLLDRQLEAEAALREHLPVRGRRGHLRARHGRNGQGKLHWVRRRLCVFENYLIQWAPLNGITLGLRETDSYNPLILISERSQHTLGRK